MKTGSNSGGMFGTKERAKRVVGIFLSSWMNKDWQRMATFTRYQWKMTNVNHCELIRKMFQRFPLSRWGLIGFKKVSRDSAVVRLHLHLKNGRKDVISRKVMARIYRDGLSQQETENFPFGIDVENLLSELNR